MTQKFVRASLAAAALLACFGAQADYTSPDGSFSMSGFGTLGFARSSTDDALFNYRGQGGGADRSGSLHPDTKVAVQGTYRWSPSVSATGQVMTKYNEEGDYVPRFEWLFAKWQASPGLTLRAGRMGAPFFMISDFRDVGYAITQVRPNLDVYAQVPVSSFEGVDLSYQSSMGSAMLTSTLWAGRARADFSSALRSPAGPVPPATIDIKDVMGLNLQLDLDDGLSVRFGYTQGKLTISSATSTAIRAGLAAPLSGVLGATAQQQAQALADAVTQDGTGASFTGLGFNYDNNDIVLSGEFTKRRIDGGYVPSTTGWYLVGGYRFGSFLPYVVASRSKVDDPNTTMPGVTIPQLAPAAIGVQAVLNTQKVSQRTLGAGLRWDASSGLAVKMQLDHIRKPKDSGGLFLMPNPSGDILANGASFVAGKKSVNVVTLSLDYVF